MTDIFKTLAALEKLIPKENRQDGGPRNLPKPDARKQRRTRARASRKANRHG